MSVIDVWKTALFIATIVGGIVTAWGVIGGLFTARRELNAAEERIGTMQRLMAQESEESAAHRKEHSDGLYAAPWDMRQFLDAPEEVAAASEARFAEAGIVRPELSKIELLPMHESVRLLRIIFSSARGDLITAGVGLVISTAASALSLLPLTLAA